MVTRLQTKRRPQRYSDEEILSHIRRDHNSGTYQEEAQEQDWASIGTVIKRFGAWPIAQAAAIEWHSRPDREPIPLREDADLPEDGRSRMANVFEVKIPDCAYHAIVILPNGKGVFALIAYLKAQGILEINPVLAGHYAVECELGR